MSLLAHAAVLALGVWLVERAVTTPPPPPARIVYVEPAPAPPPPPPQEAPVNAPVAPLVPQPVVEEPPKEVPKRQKPQRLVVPHKPKHVAPTPPPAAPGPPGVQEGAVGGVAGGVVGGEAGGEVGGVAGGHGDAPIPAGQTDRPPVVVSRVLPVYPPLARARRLEGRVVLRAVVDRNGHVEQAIKVIESEPMFDAAAVDALRQWRFDPGRDRKGTPVRVIIDVPVRFQLR